MASATSGSGTGAVSSRSGRSTACIVGIAATGPAAGVQTLILLDLERLLGGEAAPVQNTCSGARNS